MSMSDLMSRLGGGAGGHDLAFYPQVAMVIFLIVFFAVSMRVWRKGRGTGGTHRGEYTRAASLPLDDGPIQHTHARTTTEASR